MLTGGTRGPPSCGLLQAGGCSSQALQGETLVWGWALRPGHFLLPPDPPPDGVTVLFPGGLWLLSFLAPVLLLSLMPCLASSLCPVSLLCLASFPCYLTHARVEAGAGIWALSTTALPVTVWDVFCLIFLAADSKLGLSVSR